MSPSNTGVARRLSSAVVVLVLVAAACGDGEEGADSTSTSTSISTTTTSTTTARTTAASTTIPATTSSTAPTTTARETTTSSTAVTVQVDTVVDWVQGWLEDEFARTDPPDGVVGPYRLVCEDTGLIEVGGVLACAGIPRTEPNFPLDPLGVVIYPLGDDGKAAWTEGTDLCDTTECLHEAYGQAAKGLFCRDLLSPEGTGGLFNGSGLTPEGAFFWSLVYWSLEGEPNRMDEDGNGIPCETLYESDIVDSVLHGGPAS